MLVAVAGAGLGLLPFNLPPASVYLGDSGALLLGFILGALSIRAATGTTEAVFIAVPIVALGFPILDTVLAVVRRVLDHRNPLLGDQDHIHHRLEHAGFGPRGLLAVLYTISALLAGAAILLHYVHVFALEALVLVGVLLLVAAILTRLGYIFSLWNSASIIWLRRRLGVSHRSVAHGSALSFDLGDAISRRGRSSFRRSCVQPRARGRDGDPVLARAWPAIEAAGETKRRSAR